MGDKQINLMDIPEPWEDEWVGMPEYVQEKQEPFSKIIFRFKDKDSLDKFSNLIGQKLTEKTKSAWFPELKRGLNSNKRYKDEP